MSLLKPFTTITFVVNTIVTPFRILGSWFNKLSKIKIPKWVLQFLHLTLIIGVLALVVWLHVYVFKTYELVQNRNPVIKFGFPALVALLLYAAIRTVLYILRQLPTARVAFPDIEEAVNEGVAALAAAGLNIKDVPLFLAVGFSPQDERAFAESSVVGKDVSLADADLALHWYGDHRGIFVSMSKVSAITAQLALSQQARGGRGGGGQPVAMPAGAAPDDGDQFRTQPLGAMAGAAGARGDGAFATMGAMNPGDYSTIAVGNPGAASTLGAIPEALVIANRRLDADDRDLIERRIRFFIERLREVRYPVCNINGIVLAVPYAWTSSPGLAQLSDVVKIDMGTLQETIGAKCLCFTILTGIEQFQDFRTYMSRLDKPQLDRRFGCGFPNPSLYSPVTEDVERTHAWLMQYFERQVFELFQRKLGDPTNGDLFRLLDRIRKARSNFTRVLKQAFPDEVVDPVYLGGVYFASFEPVSGVRLPFFNGVLAKLMQEHDEVVGWTEKSLAEDKQMERLARGFWIASGALVILNALVILYMILWGK